MSTAYQIKSKNAKKEANKKFAKGVARAFGGAIIFALPVLMTMEMWWLGFYMNNLKLALFLILTIPFLTGLSYFVGFRKTFKVKEDAMDAFVAYAIGFATSALILFMFSIIDIEMPLGEVIGKISLQAIPCSIGALFAQSQLGGGQNNKKDNTQRDTGYSGELFIMLAGALYLSFSLAPTQEMVLIAYKMNSWHLLGLLFLSLFIMHSFVYAMEFKGQATPPKGSTFWSLFLRHTIVGYAIALLVSFYILWTFDRTGGQSAYQTLNSVIVLGFPAAVGAAAARLIL
jgi:putative integral membrane protein (TIGR02587 family)